MRLGSYLFMFQIREKIAALRRIERFIEANEEVFKGADIQHLVDKADESGIKKWFDKNAPAHLLPTATLRERAKNLYVLKWWELSKEQLLEALK